MKKLEQKFEQIWFCLRSRRIENKQRKFLTRKVFHYLAVPSAVAVPSLFCVDNPKKIR